MILGAHYGEPSFSQSWLHCFKKPIACRESSDQNDMLLWINPRSENWGIFTWRWYKYLHTDTLLCAVLCWSATARMMHSIEGWKNVATSVLCVDRKPYVIIDSERLQSYPASLSCPKRMPQLESLSRVDPNLMYWGSWSFLNLGLVVVSKHSIMWSISLRNLDSERNSSVFFSNIKISRSWVWRRTL